MYKILCLSYGENHHPVGMAGGTDAIAPLLASNCRAMLSMSFADRAGGQPKREVIPSTA